MGQIRCSPRALASDVLELPDLPAEPWAQLVRDCLALEPTGQPTTEEIVHRLTLLLDPHAAAVTDDMRKPDAAATRRQTWSPNSQPARTD